jgi:hypothetical protein
VARQEGADTLTAGATPRPGCRRYATGTRRCRPEPAAVALVSIRTLRSWTRDSSSCQAEYLRTLTFLWRRCRSCCHPLMSNAPRAPPTNNASNSISLMQPPSELLPPRQERAGYRKDLQRLGRCRSQCPLNDVDQPLSVIIEAGVAHFQGIAA